MVDLLMIIKGTMLFSFLEKKIVVIRNTLIVILYKKNINFVLLCNSLYHTLYITIQLNNLNQVTKYKKKKNFTVKFLLAPVMMVLK